MQDQPWSRSKFWLCHFLHSRHERDPIDWQAPAAAEPVAEPAGVALGNWLRSTQARSADIHQRRWLIDRAAAALAIDPAYVQCLRLMVKEEQFHLDLARLGLKHLNREHLALPEQRGARVHWTYSAWLQVRRALGIRFELSVILLWQIMAVTLARLVPRAAKDPALLSACAQMQRDQLAHLSFHAERLTLEFADFNFIRRNLRRWRLRAMFAGTVALGLWRHSGLVRAAGMSRRRFALDCWANFNSVLEQMVPYRRDALAAVLLDQSEHPYDKPHVIPSRAGRPGD